MQEQFEVLKRHGYQYSVVENKEVSIPIVYRKKYKFSYLTLFDEIEVLTISKTREFSIETFAQDSLYLSQRLKMKVLLIFDELSEVDIKRLISSNIPYISNHSISLPFLGAVIEKIKKPKVLREFFTINHQKVLIYILLNQEPSIRAKEIQKSLNMPIASVYRSLKYFTDLGYIKSNHGSYAYQESRKKIYEDSKYCFVSPILNKISVPRKLISYFEEEGIDYFESGIDALSMYSMLASQKQEFGVARETLLSFVDKAADNNMKNIKESHEFLYIKKILALPNIKDNDSIFIKEDEVILEIWEYVPKYKEEVKLDPINLLLLIDKDNEDPRVQAAIIDLEKHLYSLWDY